MPAAKAGGENCACGESRGRGCARGEVLGAWGVPGRDVSEAGSAWDETSGRNVYFVPVLIWMLRYGIPQHDVLGGTATM